MKKLLNDFLDRYFHDEESIILVFLLGAVLLIFLLFGGMLAPLITAVIIAYLMQGLVSLALRYGLSEGFSFVIVYVLFFGIFVTMLGFLLPQVWNQLRRIIDELPNLLNQGQDLLLNLPESYPNLFSEDQVKQFMDGLGGEIGSFGQTILEYSLASLPNIFSLIIFLVLVPILVFFMMKDKSELLNWVANFLPRNRPLMSAIWKEMDGQIANYIRGKFLEILIVGGVSYLVFSILGLNYALLLSVITGLSVIVPYIGAAVVNVPIAVIGYVQWGIGGEFWTILIAYNILQLLDGNVLVPVIFSEAVNLHPVAIISAVLFFGGIWGLAGVFFAIPLATLIKAIINAWPSRVQSQAI
ncbi:MAG: AI-2E family transporter [Gammaproteobacteria bacterium]|nr:AI-2E family transporter [Gammaproteobacteria bacterium]